METHTINIHDTHGNVIDAMLYDRELTDDESNWLYNDGDHRSLKEIQNKFLIRACYDVKDYGKLICRVCGAKSTQYQTFIPHDLTCVMAEKFQSCIKKS